MTEEALCPAQQRAYDQLQAVLPHGNLFVLTGDTGMGRTTVMRSLHGALGGAYLSARDVVSAMNGQHPLSVEETVSRLVMEALANHQVVLIDDFNVIHSVVSSYQSPRSEFINLALHTWCAYAATAGRTLLVATDQCAPDPINQRCFSANIGEFKAEDYQFLCETYLNPDQPASLDFVKVHRFAPRLNAHQLKGVCIYLRSAEKMDTEIFIEFLRSQHLASNVHLGEVEAVDLYSLKGVDDVIRSLEANIILPLENDALAAELDIRPKRGVLLAGPPGTGKTTVGRALAHRLKSKFFLIDGTFISGTEHFYERFHRIYHAAVQNAPSILFIDDSDVIFESGEESGLYRYLLTMLDGLESASAGRVCVMMTAMDVGNLPPALMRSGRVELWLETKLPDGEARAAILRERMANLPEVFGGVELEQIAAATDGFTGADLKRLVEDGKLLFAYDKAKGLPLLPATHYFLAATETVRANHEQYARAEARARQHHGRRPPWFDVAHPGFGDASPDVGDDDDEE